MRPRLLGGTLAAGAGLALAAAWVMAPVSTASSPAPPELPDPLASQAPPPALPAQDLDAFAVIAARPLFTPGRRPPAPPVPAATAPVRTPPFVLHGVIRSARQQVVLLRPTSRGALVRAQPGDRVAGWEIVAVQPQAVTVRHGTVEVQLPLARPGAPGLP